jgi:hypothetical protein
VEDEFVGCRAGDNAWSELEDALSRIPEQSYPLTKTQWKRVQRAFGALEPFAQEDLSCKTPHMRMK